ncbi:MAG TPA: hypothetical protein PLA94_12630 [Myxococcota bacterium]|nr:hypothetical protein [Myxococcota bacterium]
MIDTENLYWLHAFRRGSPADIAKVLCDGADPYPNPATSTSQNEAKLGITPARVYAYLGRTSDTFGDRAVAVRFDAPTGELSPFDTGGLIDHIRPVCSWSSDTAKTSFLRAYTWKSESLSKLLRNYPGAAITSYLQGERPEPADPSEVWTHRHQSVKLWSTPQNEWRAWTWEIRSPGRLPTGERLIAWTCDPDERQSILNALRDLVLPEQDHWVDLLSKKYVKGGVAALVEKLRKHQVEAHA